MGTPTVTDQNTTPVQASSSSDEFIVLATPRRDYYLEMEISNFMSPIQETCQSVSSQTLFQLRYSDIICTCNYNVY